MAVSAKRRSPAKAKKATKKRAPAKKAAKERTTESAITRVPAKKAAKRTNREEDRKASAGEEGDKKAGAKDPHLQAPQGSKASASKKGR